jgi:glutaredoxin 3
MTQTKHSEATMATPKVTMYSTAVCPYCINAERLLTSKGVQNIEKIRIDLQPELRMEMMEKTGRRTVPQIYIGEHYVGGFDDLRALDLAGKLDSLLKSSS